MIGKKPKGLRNRNGSWHLVMKVDGKQVSVSLRTQDADEAVRLRDTLLKTPSLDIHTLKTPNYHLRFVNKRNQWVYSKKVNKKVTTISLRTTDVLRARELRDEIDAQYEKTGEFIRPQSLGVKPQKVVTKPFSRPNFHSFCSEQPIKKLKALKPPITKTLKSQKSFSDSSAESKALRVPLKVSVSLWLLRDVLC
jgi:hypothetical protein